MREKNLVPRERLLFGYELSKCDRGDRSLSGKRKKNHKIMEMENVCMEKW